MTAFDRAWALLKDQTPDFNPGLESEEGWMGNMPRNAEEAYMAVSQNKPVYHCPSCDAYTDNEKCYGQAYESFRTTPDHIRNPRGHAYKHQRGGIAGVENTTPTWRMSARERYGIGYHPVPDPSDPPQDDDDFGIGMLSDLVGSMNAYGRLPAEDKPRLRDFFEKNRMDEARQQRIMYLHYLMEQSGLSQDELKAFLQAKPSFSGDVGREQQELRDSYSDEYNGWMKDFWAEDFE